MTVALIVLGVVAVMALLTIVALASHRDAGPPLKGKTVVVYTRKPDDRTLRGVLLAEHADRITLGEAFVVQAADRQQALGGLVHLPRGSIAFVQEIVGADE